MKGKNFLDLLSDLLPLQFNPKWKLRRSIEKNLKFRVEGVIIVGKLTNKVLGEALTNRVNLILTTATLDDMYYHDAESELIEYLYKYDIRVIEWNIAMIHQTDLGYILVAKICNADDTWSNKLPSIQVLKYPNSLSLDQILSRLSPSIIQSRYVLSSDERKFDVAYFLHNAYLDLSKFNPKNQLILCVQTPNCLELLLANNNVVVTIERTQFLNEVSRELYYVIKPGQKLPIHLEFNDLPVLSIK